MNAEIDVIELNTRSEYIQGQLEHLQSELSQVNQDLEVVRGKVLSDNDSTFIRAANAITIEAGRLCDQATAISLKHAEGQAWLPALALSAPWGVGRPQVLAWLGLLLGALLLSGMMGMGTRTAFVLFVAGYVSMVHWGRGRAALRASQPEREAIDGFRALRPVLMACDTVPTPDAEYPYRVTMAPLTDDENFSASYRFNQKKHGQQFGATFVGLRPPGGRFCLLSRLADGGFGPKVITFNEFDETDPRWPVWSRLASDLADSASTHGPSIRAYAEDVASMVDHSARIRLIEQRITTLTDQERAWADVALPDETLDGILRLVDTFKSGRPVKGMLLYGPPGTGKTLIARKLAQHAGCNFVAVGTADLKSEHIGGTAPLVKQVWQSCRENAPTILFVDECESIFAARGSADSDRFSAELVQTFLAEWDGFNQSAGQVFVVGATNRHDLIDNAIMSRFTEAIEIATPDAQGRRKILASEIDKAHMLFAPTDDMIRETAGMSGRDIHTLMSKIVASHLHGKLSQEDFVAAVRKLRGKQSTSIERLGWDALVLPDSTLAEFKGLGRELVHAEELRKLGVSVPRGILLYGPPGTGKTQVARVLASESGLAFIAAGSSDLKAGYIGQSGGKVKQLFEKARSQAPCILFLDEIDTIAQSRGNRGGDSFTAEIVAQLLQELDGVATKSGQVFLLGASNHPQSIDSALLSRFERKIEIGLPEEDARCAILTLQLAGKPVGFDAKEACAALAARTDGMSGRDLQSLVTTATRKALQRAMEANGDPRTLSLLFVDLESSLGA